MILLFAGLATYSKNGGLLLVEEFLVFIRDEIAIPNIGEKHYKKYMSYLLTIFSLYYLNIFGLMPLE
jgi:F-type H+-transporting ATPase subunit a